MTGFPSPDYQVVMGGEEMKDRLPMSKSGVPAFLSWVAAYDDRLCVTVATVVVPLYNLLM